MSIFGRLLNFAPKRGDRGEQANRHAGFAMPTTDNGWFALREWYWSAYYAEGYREADHKDLGLFQALDIDGTNPQNIASTLRLLSDFPFVVNVAAALTAGGGITLNDPEAAANNAVDGPGLALAKAIWRRSRMNARLGEIVTSTMMQGEGYVESVRTRGTAPFGAKLIGHDARSVRVEYDEGLDEIEQAEITIHDTDADGVPTRTRRRILTRTEVIIEVNGKIVPELGGPHLLGAVPLAHLRAIPVVGCGERHAVSVAHELRTAMAQIDSAHSQARAILTRNGNPIMTMKGAVLANDGGNPMQLGRVLNLPNGADASYLTAAVDSVRAALEVAKSLRDTYVATMPEFLFSQLTSGESGEARRFRTEGLVSKYTAMRERVMGELRRVIQMAVEMEEGVAHDPNRERIEISQPPVLAIDVAAEIDGLVKLRQQNLIRVADAVRELQGLGKISADRDPEEYAALLADDQAMVASQFFDPPKAAPVPAPTPEQAPEYP